VRHRQIADEIEAQLLAARWGIVISLAVWAIVSAIGALAIGEDWITVDEDERTVTATLLIGSIVCAALACWLWFDSSERRLEERRRAIVDRGSWR
jgi:uncharacterized membrane protein